MPISYAGVNLIEPLSSEWNDTVKWVETHVQPEDVYSAEGRTWTGLSSYGRQFPVWMNPTVGPIIPGRLRWPTGATRWARGYYFAGKTEHDTILGITGGNTSANLVVSDNLLTGGTPGSITADMYLLSALPVAQHPGDEPVYLLTFVDQRYFWQFERASWGVPSGTTWGGLIDNVATALGITILSDTIEAVYQTPTDEFACSYEPLGEYLDTLCSAVGKKVIVDLDGTVRVMNPVHGRGRADANAALLSGTLHSGGQYVWEYGSDTHLEALNQFLPTQVVVAFPNASSPDFVSNFSTVSVTGISTGITELGSLVGALPDYNVILLPRATYSGATWTNQTALTNLAKQWAADWYRWRLGYLAPGCSGIVPFEPDGLHQEIQWDHRFDYIYTKLFRGHYDQMRELQVPVVQSNPANFFQNEENYEEQIVYLNQPITSYSYPTTYLQSFVQATYEEENYEETTVIQQVNRDEKTKIDTLSSTTNNYQTGDYDYFSFNGGGADFKITGFDGGRDGRVIEVTNTDIGHFMSLSIQDAGSLTANQIEGAGAEDLALLSNAATVVGTYETAVLKYLGGSKDFWQVMTIRRGGIVQVNYLTTPTAGSFFTPRKDTRYLEVWVYGAGGGGGAIPATNAGGGGGVTSASAAGGGGSGGWAYSMYELSALAFPYKYCIATAGTGGTVSGGVPTDGGDATGGDGSGGTVWDMDSGLYTGTKLTALGGKGGKKGSLHTATTTFDGVGGKGGVKSTVALGQQALLGQGEDALIGYILYNGTTIGAQSVAGSNHPLLIGGSGATGINAAASAGSVGSSAQIVVIEHR